MKRPDQDQDDSEYRVVRDLQMSGGVSFGSELCELVVVHNVREVVDMRWILEVTRGRPTARCQHGWNMYLTKRPIGGVRASKRRVTFA